MGASRRRMPRPYSCISGSGPNSANTCSRWSAVSRDRSTSSWLRRNVAHCPPSGSFGVSRSASMTGSGFCRASASMSLVFSMKSNSMWIRLLDPDPSPKKVTSWSGSTFASASSTASPRRHCTNCLSSVRNSKSFGELGLPGSVSSMMNGTASIRNPATPSWSQNAQIFLISSRTWGFLKLRSGWNL
jgi:hypothetical protein